MLALVIVMIGTLSGCTSFRPNDSRLSDSSDDSLYLDSDLLPSERVETEAELEEELSGLQKLGPWEEGISLDRPAAEVEITNDFPLTINKQVHFYLDLFQHKQHHYFQKWLERSTLYLSDIENELEKSHLPPDLAYLAMIESGFNPLAYSPAHAAGLWQFITITGRKYDLKINSWIDERRHPHKSTKAAVAYLADLYNEFNDWYLAVAAYNAGAGKIRQAIRKYKTRDFWKIAQTRSLHLETKRYVPKLIAAILIARNPAAYGFTRLKYRRPTRPDQVTVPGGTDLAAMAVAANTSLQTLRILNGELRRAKVPVNLHGYRLNVPRGRGQLAAANLKRIRKISNTSFKTHVVRRGDTLSRICKRYNISKTRLLKSNKIRNVRLRPGQHLRIPYEQVRYALADNPERRTVRLTGGSAYHRLRNGETLSHVAKKFHTSVNKLMASNGIVNVRKVRAGQLLLVADNSAPTITNRASHAIVVLTDRKKTRVTEAKTIDRRPVWYQVRSGDSLWTIARKFQVSATDIKRWNQLRSNMIHPGRRLVVRKG